MFQNPMPEDTDAQAAELDFEGQAAAAEQQPATPQQAPPPPAYQPPAPQYAPEPQYEPQVSPQDPYAAMAAFAANNPDAYYEQLSELAEEDPVEAHRVMSEVDKRHVAATMAEAYAPIVEDYHERQAAAATDALRAEYGDETLEQVIPALVPFIEANEGAFTNPATADAALRMAIDSILYRGGPPPVDPDAAAIEAIGEFAPSSQAQDRFGAQGAPSRPSVGNVYVEGGSTPPPPARPPMTVDDAIKAEIDLAAEGSGRDVFGKRGVPKR